MALSAFDLRFRSSSAHLLICFCLILSPCSVFSITNPQDVNALIALHSAWSSNPRWDIRTDPCDDDWLGVRCDSSPSARVVRLILINQRLNGTIPAVIGDLTNLTDLDLSSNPGLTGSLPTEIGKLTSLRKMFMQFCSLSGPIPSAIQSMTSLEYLGLTRNGFTGSLPESIGLLTRMIWLDLSSNLLNGSLPVSTNTAIRAGLDNLTRAEHFHLQNNSFSGSIPGAIFNRQMHLLHLLLHNNSFDGIIPSNIGELVNVKIVRFDFNYLNGSIPTSVSNMQNLTTLDLHKNALTGSIPDLRNNTKLQMLELGNNNFDASPIPSWIIGLTNLRLIALESTNLNGTIPPELFSLPEISNVTLQSNSLSGTLNLTQASSTLLVVDVTDNSISNLNRGAYTGDVLLDGNLYCNDSNQTDCTTVRAATPPTVQRQASPAPSTCSNSCPDEYSINPKVSGNCQCVRPVNGDVTFVASELPLLTAYNTSLIEQQFINIGLNPYLAVYNVNFNLTQVVVNAITSTRIGVSVYPPDGTVLWRQNDASAISYVLKNQNVQFTDIGPIVCEFSGTPYASGAGETSLSTGAKVGIGLGVAAAVAVIVLLALYALRLRKRAEKAETQNKPFAAWIAASDGKDPNIPQLKGARWFSLAEIKKCTNNFSQNNEIGEGGYGKVYKGYLLSGERVAIKRAGAGSMQGATEFRTEIELLSRVHHKNLLGLIGFCFEEGEQMLVYEFMPNGTVKESLSGQSGIDMGWEKRIACALGSARGIAYLHTEAHPPIIHRDIKSANILLDEKLVPKVADFGLSKLAPKDDGAGQWSTEVKGTLGYLDPDYFMTNRLTEKSDVYSFGVILLELITGRQPIQGGTYVVREMKKALHTGGMPSALESMVDPNLTDFPPEKMERLILLSLRCVEELAMNRPSMSEVVKELESLSPALPSRSMDVEMRDERSELYGEGSPYMNMFATSTSFETGGSYPPRSGDSVECLLAPKPVMPRD